MNRMWQRIAWLGFVPVIFASLAPLNGYSMSIEERIKRSKENKKVHEVGGKKSAIYSKLVRAVDVVEVEIESPPYNPTGPSDVKRYDGKTTGRILGVFKGNKKVGDSLVFKIPFWGGQEKGDKFIYFLSSQRVADYAIKSDPSSYLYMDFKKVFSRLGDRQQFELKIIEDSILILRKEIEKDCSEAASPGQAKRCISRRMFW